MICECPNCVAFQPKAEKCDHAAFYMKRWCAQCGEVLKDKEKPDPVEESSKEIIDTVEIHGKLWLEMKLRELVALARRSK